MRDPDARETLVSALRDDGFVSAVLSGAVPGASTPAERVTIRPVDLRDGRHLQFSSFDGRATDVVNLTPELGVERFEGLLGAGFSSVYVKTLRGDLQLSHSRKGAPRLARHRATAHRVVTEHDRDKRRVLDPAAPFLRAVGIADDGGHIKPSARAKHRQVERFVEILSHVLPDDLEPGTAFAAVDLGCGAGVLTLATYHYLRDVRGLDVTMTGVDTKRDLMDRLTHSAAELGWDRLRFETGVIDVFEPAAPPDLVLALHACDTATDDALAAAVRWGSRFVLAAPCCQHDLQAQLDADLAPPDLAPLLRDGIVRERLGDLITDSLRAELLRASGYRTDVIEFVSTEHTAKNLMIRAVRTGHTDTAAAESAQRLATAWGVEPALARRLSATAS